MPWFQIELKVSADECSALENLLWGYDACSVTLSDASDQPIYEPDLGTTPLWSGTILHALFTEDTDINAVVERLKAEAFDYWKTHKLEIIEDRAWEKEWIKDFHPMQFGEKLWVCPSWSEPPDPDAVNIMLDPGCGFGTGTHPTTAMCLESLSASDLKGKYVIDYGCGSGILAIAAILSGADSALAVDIDKQALEATRLNAERNGINKNILKTVYPDNVSPLEADIVIANILSGPLTELAPVLSLLVKAGGKIILSGILSYQIKDLLLAYEPCFTMDEPLVYDKWALLTGIKK